MTAIASKLHLAVRDNSCILFIMFFLSTTEADNSEMMSAQKIISKQSSTNLSRG